MVNPDELLVSVSSPYRYSNNGEKQMIGEIIETSFKSL